MLESSIKKRKIPRPGPLNEVIQFCGDIGDFSIDFSGIEWAGTYGSEKWSTRNCTACGKEIIFELCHVWMVHSSNKWEIWICNNCCYDRLKDGTLPVFIGGITSMTHWLPEDWRFEDIPGRCNYMPDGVLCGVTPEKIYKKHKSAESSGS